MCSQEFYSHFRSLPAVPAAEPPERLCRDTCRDFFTHSERRGANNPVATALGTVTTSERGANNPAATAHSIVTI